MVATFTATVTDIRLYSRENGKALWQISLDRSQFQAAPRSGGVAAGTLTARNQSGTVLTVPVLEVTTDSSAEIWHLTDKPLPVGTHVECQVF